jgi:adenylate kinase
VFHVVYLTGAPASGKSTTTKLLAQLVTPLEVFEFGEKLTSYLAEKAGKNIVQAEVRRQSAGLVTPEDVKAVDRLLLDFVAEARSRTHIVIDSHPVTKESYGYRVTPYSLDEFALLAPTQIWVLYADPETTVTRIGRDAQGRPMITRAEAALHNHLQASVATTYGMRVGIPVHLFDTSRVSADEIAAMLARRLAVGPTGAREGPNPCDVRSPKPRETSRS